MFLVPRKDWSLQIEAGPTGNVAAAGEREKHLSFLLPPPHLPMGSVCREPVDWPAGIGHSVKQQSRGRARKGFEGKHL